MKICPGIKGWVVGYLIDSITPEEIRIFKNISALFGSAYFYFFVDFHSRSSLMRIKLRAFGVANLQSMKFNHWLVTDPLHVHSFNYLVKFVENVSSGQIPLMIPSESEMVRCRCEEVVKSAIVRVQRHLLVIQEDPIDGFRAAVLLIVTEAVSFFEDFAIPYVSFTDVVGESREKLISEL
jgi:uncharacterized membrane protein YbhN (UPF0104 family)